MDVRARLNYETVRFDVETEASLVVSLKAPKLEWEQKRPPICVVPAIDVSGSMEGDKLAYAKQSAMKMLGHLKPGDYFGLVTFTTTAVLVQAPVEVTPTTRETALGKIGALTAQESTNFSGGMLLALEQVNRADLPPNLLTRVIMFTDGLANAGVSDRNGIQKLLGANLGRATLSAFGYGADCDQELLADLARQGKGNYAYIDSPEKALTAFAKELGGLLSTYAQDISIVLSPHNGHKFVEVVSDVSSKEEDGKLVVTLPDILSEEERHVVVAMKLSKQTQHLPRALTVVDVKVTFDRFKDDGTKTAEAVEVKAKVQFVKEGEQQAQPTREAQEIVNLHKLVQTQVQAEQMAVRGNYAGAAQALHFFSQDMQEQGYGNVAAAAAMSSNYVSSSSLYTAGGAYRASVRGAGGGSRASSFSAEAAEKLGALNIKVTNSAEDASIASFTSGSAVVVPATPVPPPSPTPPVVPSKLTKSRSKRW